jgi:uncharacterized membrane protein YdbT with pleckstrin-like domain
MSTTDIDLDKMLYPAGKGESSVTSTIVDNGNGKSTWSINLINGWVIALILLAFIIGVSLLIAFEETDTGYKIGIALTITGAVGIVIHIILAILVYWLIYKSNKYNTD